MPSSAITFRSRVSCGSYQGTVFLPEVCFSWKQQLIRKYGKEFVEIKTVGESFEEAQSAADQFVKEGGKKIIHPCDNIQNIIGNGTIVRARVYLSGS